MTSSGGLSFPTLSDEELINLCTEVVGGEIPITMAALRNPTTESTMAVFRFFVNDVFGWDLDAAQVVPFDQMSRVQFFETHQEQVPLVRFYAALNCLLKGTHYDMFGMDDLLQPRAKRLRRQLSALANFALYNQRMTEEYGDAVHEQYRHGVLDYERLVKENRSQKSNIHKAIEREDDLKAKIREEQELVEERNQKISELHDQKEQAEQEAKQTRSEIARQEDQIRESEVEEAKLNEEKHSLEAQLVGSPEKVRQTLVRAQEELRSTEEQRDLAAERRHHLRGVSQQSQQLAAGLQRLQQHIDVLRDLAQRHGDTENQIQSVTDEIEAMRKEISERHSSNRQVTNRCEMIEESRETEMRKSEGYLRAKEDQLEKRQPVLEEARARLAADRQTAAQLAERQQQLKQREQEHSQLWEQRLTELQQRDDQLLAAVEFVKDESSRMQDKVLEMLESWS